MSDIEYDESESENESETEMDVPKKVVADIDDISVADSDNDNESDDDTDVDIDIDVDDINEENLFNEPLSNKRDLQKSKISEMNNDILNEYSSDDENDDDDDDINDPDYFKKFDENIKHNIISEYHPEMVQHNYQEVEILANVLRNEHGVIVDPFHKTLPFLTKYEKARILGERARQLNIGAASFISVDSDMIDGYLIALKELEEKKIPFIIKRPLPNGGCEYWKLRDLEFIH